MRQIRFPLLGGVLLIALLVPLRMRAAFTAHEQQFVPGLQQLLLATLELKKPDASLEARIDAERARIRKILLGEFNASVDQETTQEENPLTVLSPLNRQKAIVTTLQTQEEETTVDLDVLRDEEDAISAELQHVANAATKRGLLQRKAGVLAKQAILEERDAALQEVLQIQRDRLARLNAQERSAKFIDVVQIVGFLGIIILIILVERVIRHALIAKIRDRNRRYLAMKVFTGTVYLLLIGWLLYRLFADQPGVVTSFAIVGAGIAVALQSVIKDLVGWIIIMQKRLFTLGQRVTIGPYTGDVADISLLRTMLVEVGNSQIHDVGRSGRTLYVPNAMVLEHPVLNFSTTSDFIEAEIPLTIRYGGNWKKAEEILLEILQNEVGEFVERARRQYMHRTVHFFATQEPPGPRVFIDFSPKGILFTLRFQIPIGHRRTIISRITKNILERFSQEPAITLWEE